MAYSSDIRSESTCSAREIQKGCVCVCAVRTGSATVPQRDMEAPSIGKATAWRRFCNKPPGRPPSARTAENFAQVSVSVGRSPRRSDRSVGHTLHSDRNLHQYKLHIVHSLSDRDGELRLQFCRHFQGVLTGNPDPPTHTSDDRWSTLPCTAQWTSRTLGTGQLQILTNFISVSFMTQKLLFGPEESLDPTSLRMKTGRPSQAHRVTHR